MTNSSLPNEALATAPMPPIGEEAYRRLFEAMDEGFCIAQVLFDEDARPTDYRFVAVNAAFEAQTGLHSAVGRTMRSLRPEHEDHWFQTYGRVALTGEPTRFVNLAAALDRWYDVYACRIGQPHERLVAIIFRDITALKQAERERDALESRMTSDLEAMRRLHELSTQLVEITDLHDMLDRILDATIAIQRADFGNIQLYDAEHETLSIVAQRGFEREFLEHFGVVDASDVSACGRALRERSRIMIEDVSKDAGFAPHLEVAQRAGYRAVQSSPILASDGRPIGLLSTHFREPHRLTERDLHLTDLFLRIAAELVVRGEYEVDLRDARDEAERASQAKSRFLSVMSHELRTPLNAVIGLSELLQQEVRGPLNDWQQANVGRIRTSAWHLVSIIDEILTYTRTDAGIETVHVEEVDLAEIVRDVVDMLSREAELDGLALRLSGADAAVTASTDGNKVRQVVINLVNNALRYTTEGSIDLALTADADWLDLSVCDTGCGIDADRLDDIFDPFVQVDSSTTRAAAGTGLGLAICRRFARLLGGDIHVRSVLGDGSTFTLRLPRRYGSGAATGD